MKISQPSRVLLPVAIVAETGREVGQEGLKLQPVRIDSTSGICQRGVAPAEKRDHHTKPERSNFQNKLYNKQT